MSNAEVWNLVISIFTFAGFLHYILTRKTRIKQSKKMYKSKKVIITPERKQKIQAKRMRKKKTNNTESYIEACWDEIQKI